MNDTISGNLRYTCKRQIIIAVGCKGVQVELIHELHQDILEPGAEERACAEEGRSHQDDRVEGAVQGGAGRNAGTLSVHPLY